MNPARGAVARAMATGLTPDPKSREAGEYHGLRAQPPEVPDWADRYSYFLGFAAGAAERHVSAAFHRPPEKQEDA